MHINWTTFALQLINFAILVWLLQRFLYRPVLRIVDARRAAVEQQFGDAAKAEAAAKDQLSNLEAQRAAIDSERSAALKAAAAEAEKAMLARRVQAEREATALLEDARKTLALERHQALEAARHAALDLAKAMLQRILSEVPDTQRAQGWLERIDQHLSSLPPDQWAALMRDLGPRATLKVVTATPLRPEELEPWRARLARAPLQTNQLAFSTDPELIAGAELHFGDTALSFTLRGALQALQAELHRHDQAS
jgi:F-type H+-transporting ATPase subunit b